MQNGRVKKCNFLEELYQIWIGHGLLLRFVTTMPQSGLEVENRDQISYYFLSTVKLGEGWAKCPSHFLPDLGPKV